MWETVKKYGAQYNTEDDVGLLLLETQQNRRHRCRLRAGEFTLVLSMLQGSDLVRYNPDTKGFRTGTEDVGEAD